jgi:hypothetical protein
MCYFVWVVELKIMFVNGFLPLTSIRNVICSQTEKAKSITVTFTGFLVLVNRSTQECPRAGVYLVNIDYFLCITWKTPTTLFFN